MRKYRVCHVRGKNAILKLASCHNVKFVPLKDGCDMIQVPDELIRRRSYEIWLRDGCPHGLAVQHWFEAKAELQAERYAALLPSPDFDFRRIVLPKPRISRLPRRLLADRIASNRTAA